jgi:SAM-dependent methyltransferase
LPPADFSFPPENILTKTATFSDYDDFAFAYNRHWGEVSLEWLPIYERLLLRRLPSEGRLLDLCCGTGQLTRRLAARGFQVEGLEGSENMLRFARRQAPGVSFTHQDARHFKLSHRFNGVISAFDSLNHIVTLPELAQVFGCVYEVLAGGGLFLFDLNTEEGYLHHWCGPTDIVDNDLVCIMQADYEAQQKFAWANTTILRLVKGQWRRSDFVLTQKCYAEAEVRSALTQIGFVAVEAHEQGRNLNVIGAEGRIFYSAQKPR